MPAERQPLKRDESGKPVAETYTREEYVRFCAVHPDNPLGLYLCQAHEVGREADAVQAVNPDEREAACERLVHQLIGKSGAGWWPKDEAKYGPTLRRLWAMEPHAVEPYRSVIAAYRLFCDGNFEQAEAVFAALPPEQRNRDAKSGLGHYVYDCRMAGFHRRGAWREAYRALEPRGEVFHLLGMRLLSEPKSAAQHEELIALHRAESPDDPMLTYHTAYLWYNQKRYGEAAEQAADYLNRPTAGHAPVFASLAPYNALDMRHVLAFSLAVLERYTEAEAMDGQLTMSLGGGGYITIHRDRVRLAVALKRGDPAKVEELFAALPATVSYAHTDPHLAPLFAAEKFDTLRKKYPPPGK